MTRDPTAKWKFIESKIARVLCTFFLAASPVAQCTSLYNYHYYDDGPNPEEPTLDHAEQDMFQDTGGGANYTNFRLAFAYFSYAGSSSYHLYLDYRPYGGMNASPPTPPEAPSAPATTGKRTFDVGNGGSPPPPTPNCGAGGAGGGSSEGDPCTVANGNQFVTEPDFEWGEIRFVRYYNSLRLVKPYGGMDLSWSHSFSQRIYTDALTDGHTNPHVALNAAFIAVQDEMAHVDFYQLVTQGADDGTPSVFRSTATPGKVLNLIQGSQGGPFSFVLYEPDGRREVFDSDGRIVALQYPDSPQKSLTITYVEPVGSYYDQQYWLTDTVTDGTGRKIQFVYEPDTSIFGSPYQRLSSIVGKHYYGATETLLSLDYDGLGNLWKAHYADNSYREYRYNEHTPTTLSHSLTGIYDEKGLRFATFNYDTHGRAAATQNGSSANNVSITYTDDDQNGTASRGGTSSAGYAFQIPSQDRTFRKPISLAVSPVNGLQGQGYTESWVYNYQDTAHCGGFNDERICRYIDKHGVEVDYSYDVLFETSRVEGAGTSEVRTIQTSHDPTFYRVTDQKVLSGAGSVISHTAYAYDSTTGAMIARCVIDPAVTYTCSSLSTPPAGVRRWVYRYCTGYSAPLGCPAAGWLQTETDPRGLITTYKYYVLSDEDGCDDDPSVGPCYRAGDLASITNPLNQTTTYKTYDYHGKLTYLMPITLGYTTLTYDPRSRLLTQTVKEFSADGASSVYGTTQYSYYPDGAIETEQDPDGVVISYVYDDAERLTDIQNDEGDYVHFTLDAEGNRIEEDTYDVHSTLYRTLSRTYDQLYRLKTVRDANGNTTTYNYDGNDRILNSIDPLGRVTESDYDGLSRLKDSILNYVQGGGQTATQNVSTSYVYDARDDLAKFSDPSGMSTNYVFDGLENLSQLVSPDTGASQFTSYDAAGHRLSRTDARSIVTNYAYDSRGRPTTTTYPSAPALNVTLAYDQGAALTGCTTSAYVGALTSAADATGTTYYCRDMQGNVRQKRQVTNGKTFVVSYAYTLAHRPMSVTYPSGAVVTYSYDSVGRLDGAIYQQNATAPQQSLVTGVAWYPFGPMSEIMYAGSHTLSRGYDQNYRVQSIVSSISTGLSVNYVEDPLGNIVTMSGGTHSDLIKYDPIYRLSDLSDTNSVSGTVSESAYTYNATGDRATLITTVNGAQTASLSYGYYPATHHLKIINVQGGGAAPVRGYDNNGNTLSWSGGPTFTYDASNRLSTTSSGGAVYTYGIDAKGERVSAVKKVNGATVSTTYYVYDEAGALLGEYDANGSVIQEYIYLESLPIGTTKANTLYEIEPDQIGTPRAVVDLTRQISIWSWPIFNDGFGTTSPNTDPDGDGTQFALNLRFPGQYADPTGFDYNYLRDYEPMTGRYLESDPIGLRGGVDTYAYTEDSPLDSADRYGLWTCGKCCPPAKGYGKNIGGITYCCNSKPVACVNPGICDGLDRETCSLLLACSGGHEDYHVNHHHYTTCTGMPDGPAPPGDKNKNECEAYRDELTTCLSVAKCKQKPDCVKNVRAVIDSKLHNRNRFCSQAGM